MRESEKNSTKWRKARLRLDLGQKEFGELLGVGAIYISEIEQGKKIYQKINLIFCMVMMG